MPDFTRNAKEILCDRQHFADCVDEAAAQDIVAAMSWYGPVLTVDLVGKLLNDDPACFGRVTTGTLEAIVEVASPMPLLTYAEAETVGRRMHDHWEKMTGAAPMAPDDMGWGDLVQLVAREARHVIRNRYVEEQANV